MAKGFKAGASGSGASLFKESPDYPGCYYRTVDGVTEWLNPPMVAGTEYRTTERFKNNVVYAKVVSFGALPNATTKTVAIGATATKIVELRATATSGTAMEPLPISSTETGEVFANIVANGTKAEISATTDMSDYSAIVYVKYIK